MRAAALAPVLAVVVNAASAGNLPCAVAERKLRESLTDPLNQAPAEFFACARSRRVCVVSMSTNQVWAADSIQQLPSDGQAAMGLVQSAASDKPALCLAGVFSGGSAAAWSFLGWKIEDGKPTPIAGMERASLNSDSVSPRGLANEIYRAYSGAN